MPAAAPIQISVHVQGSHPMALHGFLICGLVGIAPDFLHTIWLYLQKRASGPVGFGDEYAVANYHGAAGVDAFEISGPPTMEKVRLARCGINAQESGSCK